MRGLLFEMLSAWTFARVAVSEMLHGWHRGVSLVELDGIAVPGKNITLRDDGESHQVRIVMGMEDANGRDGEQNEPTPSLPV